MTTGYPNSMTSRTLWSGPDTSSSKSNSDSEARCCQLTPISVTPLVSLRLKKNIADRNGPRGGADVLGAVVAGAKTRECSCRSLQHAYASAPSARGPRLSRTTIRPSGDLTRDRSRSDNSGWAVLRYSGTIWVCRHPRERCASICP